MKKIIGIAAAIAVCVGIYLVTASPAATGGHTFEWIADTFSVDTGEAAWINYFFRKGMHFCTFGVLAVLLFFILPKWKRRYMLSWLLVTLYAATDEWHQLHVPGRSGSIKDVLLDAIGAAVALCIVYLIRRKIGKRR